MLGRVQAHSLVIHVNPPPPVMAPTPFAMTKVPAAAVERGDQDPKYLRPHHGHIALQQTRCTLGVEHRAGKNPREQRTEHPAHTVDTKGVERIVIA